jgi:Transmembrane family 220, helix
MKIFNLIFCVLFILFAGLQYNDPDPYIWIPIYLYAAALCWLAFRRKFYPKHYLAGIILFALYAAYLFFSKDGMLDWMQEHSGESITGEMKATKPWIEATREVLGLVIVIAVLTINYFYSKGQNRKAVITR